MPAQAQPSGLTPAAIEAQVERILTSQGFAKAERMKRFLRLAVEHSLYQRQPPLKEYTVGIAVFDKPPSFDPRIDAIVRVEAHRLRCKLQHYYDHEGRDDPLVISIRKGGYSAIVRKNRGGRSTAKILAQETFSLQNAEARHLYLKGRHLGNKRTPAATSEAIECFENAIKIDPESAICRVGLADCYAARAWLEMGAPEIMWRKVAMETNNALGLDPSLVVAQSTQAFRDAAFDWNWKASESCFRDAIFANPQCATAHHWYGFFCLAPQHRLNAAAQEVIRACILDPFSPVIGTHLGCVLYFRRRFGEAVDQFLRTIELDASFHLPYWCLGIVYVQLSQFDDALRCLNQARDLGCSEQSFHWARGYLYAKAANRFGAEAALDKLNSLSRKAYVSPLGIALVHAALGDAESAFGYLEKAISERTCRLIHINVEPAFDPIKTDPRFAGVLANLDLLENRSRTI